MEARLGWSSGGSFPSSWSWVDDKSRLEQQSLCFDCHKDESLTKQDAGVKVFLFLYQSQGLKMRLWKTILLGLPHPH